MKTGLYFGSFNPVHSGHLIIANHILNNTELQKIWFIVSPQNPFKKESELLSENDRLHLVQLAIKDDDRLTASDVEFSLSKPSYTIHTLDHLKKNFPDENFSIIMGSDSFQQLDKWKEAQRILDENKIFVYRRPNHDVTNVSKNIIILDSPLLEISSTAIRQLLKEKKSIRYLVSDAVREEIAKKKFYQ